MIILNSERFLSSASLISNCNDSRQCPLPRFVHFRFCLISTFKNHVDFDFVPHEILIFINSIGIWIRNRRWSLVFCPFYINVKHQSKLCFLRHCNLGNNSQNLQQNAKIVYTPSDFSFKEINSVSPPFLPFEFPSKLISLGFFDPILIINLLAEEIVSNPKNSSKQLELLRHLW